MTPILRLIAAVPLAAGLVGSPPAGPAADDPAVTRSEGPAAPGRGLAGDASPPPGALGVVEHAAPAAAAELRALRYWTPRRMAEAVPAGLLAGLTRFRALPGVGGLTSDALPLGGTAGRAARPQAPERRPAARAVAPPAPGAGAARLTAAPPASTSGARWAAGGAVTRTTGRVFLTLNGVDFVCSAGAVRSRNLDVVVTAGHCVKDGAGAWAQNWTFVPGYASGRRPYGVFAARRMFVPEPWARGGDDDHDVAMVAVAPSGGRRLNDVVGGQRIAFNQPRGMAAHGFGFPADPPYDGEHLVYCAGVARGDPHGQTLDQGLRCDLTAGSSGGPWLSSFDPASGRGVITSVSSFKYSDDPGTMYGPYFGEHTRRLFEVAERA
ncbi:hypothetical protein [Sphaerisporangium sp. TRM90804]|uniref:trypsin-like serine peptidase n=1 Tax=Sphaerisporangium sp. TRM90804 TaxID=3031113 RepID=UPI002449BA32|nr:hypothetical protein [Sphaerisporangium sp. TRM90804]MDH2425249.1 hypothetical protein [Sphaerisporangium sp. TRM90804]